MSDTTQQRALHPVIAFILLALFGGGFGFVASIVVGVALEPQSDSGLSYGQQFGLIMVPLCTLIGASIGSGISFVYSRYPRIGVIWLLATSFAGWVPTSSMWKSDLAQYGPDPSQAVLYYPPTAMCLCSLGLAIAIAVQGIWRRSNESDRNANVKLDPKEPTTHS